MGSHHQTEGSGQIPTDKQNERQKRDNQNGKLSFFFILHISQQKMPNGKFATNMASLPSEQANQLRDGHFHPNVGFSAFLSLLKWNNSKVGEENTIKTFRSPSSREETDLQLPTLYALLCMFHHPQARRFFTGWFCFSKISPTCCVWDIPACLWVL